MEHKKNKEAVKSICCIGCDSVGMITCCLIANMCPDLNVAIVDLDSSKIPVWNSKNVPSEEPGFDDILKKCQNKNLIFTTETEKAIKEADLIFLSLNESFSEEGIFKGINTEKMEKAARLIGKLSDDNKTIIQKSTMPVGANQYLSYFLDQNKNENVKFHVVYNPDFCSEGEIVNGLFNGDRVLLGSAMTPWNLPAVENVLSIYSQWIPQNKILTVHSLSSELGKLATNAFLAQKLSSLSALSLICGEMENVNVSEVLRIYSEVTENSKYLEPTFRFGGIGLERGIISLIILIRDLKFHEIGDYWQKTLDMNEHHMAKLKKKILSEFYGTLLHKKIAIFGFSYKKDVAKAVNSPASALCKSLLREGVKLSIYDPKTEKRRIAHELTVSGCSDWENNATIVDDAYKATTKANALVFCTNWPQFINLDFFTIYKNMMKPPYIFDARKFLPHRRLIEMGFVVHTIGLNLSIFQRDRENKTRNGKEIKREGETLV